MKRLPKIRSGLARLRLFRSTVRLGMMGSTAFSIVLWAMAAAFLLDFWIHMGQLERLIVLVLVVALSAWAMLRYLVPALKVYESDTSLAVMVDDIHGMHSNLVGAIQFDDEDRSQFGSGQLRNAVVEHTGKVVGGMNFLEGFSRKELVRRLGIFAVTAVICLGPAVVFSQYTGAFLKRMMLFETRYPTRTNIEVVSPGLDDSLAEGSPLKFVVHARHVSGPVNLPESGEVRIQAVKSGDETVVTLARQGKSSDPAVYTGLLNRVREDLEYTVYLGDAESDLRKLKIVPRPIVELDMEVTAPKYAGLKIPPTPQNRRQALVVEGSKVVPVVTCKNKEIVKGVIRFDGEKESFPMTRRGKTLVFDNKDERLARVVDMVRFEIDVTDINGQSPESPIKGVVHIATDLPPNAALSGYSRYVVPGATPILEIKAKDDYALDEIILHVAIIDEEGQQPETSESLAKPAGEEKVYRGSYKLNLTDLKLEKGQQLAAWVEAIDYRGEMVGKTRRSDKWIFEITDNQGVLEAMDRLTEQMDKKLDEILRAQMEAGK
ncbi:MAG: hypothetical protein HN350_12285 [Phycisphaerales bacterium]|jgi:hypothetical protein|nr:hypothetical protein [Phycisphaerales bacterium]